MTSPVFLSTSSSSPRSGPQVVQAENAFGLVDGRVETRERVHAAAGSG
jgi:hypothetical protein